MEKGKGEKIIIYTIGKYEEAEEEGEWQGIMMIKKRDRDLRKKNVVMIMMIIRNVFDIVNNKSFFFRFSYYFCYF